LVRKLEIAYLSGAPPAPVPKASPYQWANACHELFEAGRIDVLEYATRYLHARYPELTYLATMVARLNLLPRDEPGPIAFSDDPKAEIQIVRRPNCENVLLCFCAANGTLGLPINFIHHWTGRLRASLVYIKDFRNLSGAGGFPTLGPDRGSAVAELRRIVADLDGKRLYSFGVSLGGYAALYYGLELRADAVLNLAGATDLTPDFVYSLRPVRQDYSNLIKIAPDYALNLRDRYQLGQYKPRVLNVYSRWNPYDRRQAERMAGLPNVKLFAVNHVEHNVIDPLIQDGKLMTLLDCLLSCELWQTLPG
jgi:pimeloyl-ACP methyl ester carboxylesterase